MEEVHFAEPYGKVIQGKVLVKHEEVHPGNRQEDDQDPCGTIQTRLPRRPQFSGRIS